MVILEKEVERMAREHWGDPKYSGPPGPQEYDRALNAEQAKHEFLLSNEDLTHIQHLPPIPMRHRPTEKLYLPEDLKDYAIRKFGELDFFMRKSERKRHEKSLQREELKERVASATPDIVGRRTERKIMRHKLSHERHKEIHHEEENYMPGI